MILGVQVAGIVFIAVMIYLTYYHYKRRNYSQRSLILWVFIWLAMLVLIAVPSTVYGIMQTLQIERTADFFVMAGFAFFTIVIFHLYTTVKKMSKKMEDLVRQEAFRNVREKKKK